MKILVLNSGSSSIKFKLFEMKKFGVLASGICEKIGEIKGEISISYGDVELKRSLNINDHHRGFILIEQLLEELKIVEDFNRLDAIGHRVVHGGELFHKAVEINKDIIGNIETLIPLAPLHNLSNLTGIEAMKRLAPNVKQVAVFDTAFHQTMPKSASFYALPYYMYEKYGIRKYGFHGTSHSYVAKEAVKYLNYSLDEVNIITLHLGNGVSATAIKNGKSIDTTMGMSPLAGLMMGTRSGDIDPAIVIHLLNNSLLSVEEIDDTLNKQSGLKAICGVNDMREIITLSNAGDEKAQLALDMFTVRLKKQIGAYIALLGKVHIIVFTGGIGENSSLIREKTCADLEDGLKIIIDRQKNSYSIEDGIIDISSIKSKIKILVVPTDEEKEIAIQTEDILEQL